MQVRARRRSLLLAAMAMQFSRARFVEQTFLPSSVPCNCSLTTSVPAACRGRVFDRAQYEVWAKNLDFSFGRLSEPQWRTLRDQYTSPWAGHGILNGSTSLFDGYDAARSYNLLDFLPVQMRGLNDFCFVEEDRALPAGQPTPPLPPAAPRLYGKTILVPNCWGTVYELLRSMTWTRQGDLEVFHDAFSTDDKKAQAWLEDATLPLAGPYRHAQRRFGDVMAIYLGDEQMERPVLEHAVIFVDQDVVFEKAGTGDLNPFRLTDLGTVEREWAPAELGGMYAWRLRRPRPSGRRMGTFADQFSLAAEAPDPRWPQFWDWPLELQQELTLGIADNPRNVSAPPDELTLLRAGRFSFCRGERRWAPCEPGAVVVV